MKVVIISEYNHFTSIGGTEYYVKLLIKGLCKKGCRVLFLTQGKQVNETVHTIESESGSDYDVYFLPELHYSKQSIRLQQVSESWMYMKPILEKEQPDVIHAHTLTTFFNRFHFEQCVPFCKSLVFTSHVPEHYCSRGDLIQNGKRPCNGKVGFKCAICLFSKSVTTGIGNLLHHNHDKMLKELLQLQKIPVHIICVSDWQKKQLVSNGCEPTKITVVRQALSTDSYTGITKRRAQPVFSIGYLGRLTKDKGAALLLEVLQKASGIKNIRFVLGIPLHNSDPTLIVSLKKLIKKADTEILLMDSVDATTKSDFFNAIDCLFIPSFFMETGPIVLLEAILCGKKVLAPGVGGPLEFATEFPGEVINYEWNNRDSAFAALEAMQKSEYSIQEDQQKPFIKREEKFVADQIEVYRKIGSKTY